MSNGNNTNRKILNMPLIMIALLAPLIEPSGLEGLSTYVGGMWKYLHLFTLGLKWISFVAVFFLSFKRIKKWEIVTWLFVVYQGQIAIMTFLNVGLTFSSISSLLTPMVAALLFQYYMKDGDAKKFLQVVQYILGFYVVINFITILAIPEGMYMDARLWRDHWILGYRNIHIYHFLPFLAISGVNEYIAKKRVGIGLYAWAVLTIVSAYFCKSTTSLIALAALSLFILFFENRNLPNVVCIRNICIASLLLSILFVFYGFQNSFSGFIEDSLGKDVTFSKRTLIWERAVSDFKRSPIFGCGMVSYNDLFKNWNVTQMHNMFLDLLVVGGIVLVLVFAWIIYVINNKVADCNVPAMKNICTFVFIGYAVLFVTEARRDVTMLFLYLSLCYYLPMLVERYQISDNKKRVRIRFKSHKGKEGRAL